MHSRVCTPTHRRCTRVFLPAGHRNRSTAVTTTFHDSRYLNVISRTKLGNSRRMGAFWEHFTNNFRESSFSRCTELAKYFTYLFFIFYRKLFYLVSHIFILTNILRLTTSLFFKMFGFYNFIFLITL